MRIKDLPLTTNVSAADFLVVDQGTSTPVTRRATVASALAAGASGTYLPLTGGTVTGQIFAAPTALGANIDASSRLYVSGNSLSGRTSSFQRYAASSLGAVIALDKARGTPAAPAINNSSDAIGLITFNSYEATGNTFVGGASIQVNQQAAATTTGVPTLFTVRTFDEQTGSSTLVTRLSVDRRGSVSLGATSIYGAAVSVSDGAKLTVGSSTYTDSGTAASGTVAHGPMTALASSPIAAVNTGVTYTNASTLYIDGAPTAGTNVTITNPWALHINSGNSYFGGAVTLNVALSPANGGTGQTSLQAAINSLAGATTSGQFLRGNGTNVVMSAIQASDVPTLNQNTTGTAAGLSATLAVASGGTGATTAASARTSLSAAASGTNTDITSLQQSTTVAATGTATADALGYRGLPSNSQSGNYTFGLADIGKHVYSTNSGAQTITVPTNASVAIPVGSAITVVNNGTTAITFTTTGTTVYKAGTSTAWASGGTLAVRGLCTWLKVATDTWFVSGAGLS